MKTASAASVGEPSRGDLRQAEILGLCSKVIAEQGYGKASIRKIAEEMGMSVSALYYYFRSKEELLFLIQHNAFRELLERLEKGIAGVTDPERKLRILVGNHLDYFLPRLNEMIICSHEVNTLKGRAGQKVREIERRYYNIALGIVREIQAGREGPGPQPSLSTLNLFGMLNWIYMWVHPGKGKSSRLIAREICDLFLHGINSGRRSGPKADASPRPAAARGGLA